EQRRRQIHHRGGQLGQRHVTAVVEEQIARPGRGLEPLLARGRRDGQERGGRRGATSNDDEKSDDQQPRHSSRAGYLSANTTPELSGGFEPRHTRRAAWGTP